jgi:hypothetical protein
MTDGLDNYNDDDAGGRTIKGIKIKFSKEAEWLTGDDEVIAGDREFVVVEVIKTSQKWIEQQPVETIVLAAHEKFPNVDELNASAPREEWTEKFGKEVGPWQNGYAVYLLDPVTMQVYTFPTSTVGGSQAVRDLRETVGMARRMRGDKVYPRVRLTSVHMKTQYGGRDRPHFNIVGYEELGTAAVLPAAEPKLIEAKPKTANDGNGAEPKAGMGAATRAAPKSRATPKSRKDPDFDAKSARHD